MSRRDPSFQGQHFQFVTISASIRKCKPTTYRWHPPASAVGALSESRLFQKKLTFRVLFASDNNYSVQWRKNKTNCQLAKKMKIDKVIDIWCSKCPITRKRKRRNMSRRLQQQQQPHQSERQQIDEELRTITEMSSSAELQQNCNVT